MTTTAAHIIPPVMRMDTLTGYVQLARSTIYALVAEGRFPPPRTYVGTTRVWVTSEIDAWLAETLSASTPTQQAA